MAWQSKVTQHQMLESSIPVIWKLPLSAVIPGGYSATMVIVRTMIGLPSPDGGAVE